MTTITAKAGGFFVFFVLAGSLVGNGVIWVVQGYYSPMVPSLGRPFQNRDRTLMFLMSEETTTTSTTTTTTTSTTPLTDVDTRVLQDMLRSDSVDLETAEDVRKLLERGTKKTVDVQPSTTSHNNNNNSTVYASQVMQTLADTKLWRQLSRQATEWAESAQLWVTNKVENDLQVFAALSGWAWDRAVRDVARALPAAGSSRSRNDIHNNPTPRLLLQLTNTSSWRENDDATKTLGSSTTAVADEIQQVSREVWTILQSGGDSSTTTSPSQRGVLKSVAPAGRANAAARQQRAFQRQRQQRQAQRTEWTRAGGKTLDAVTELQRELRAEGNTAGYKSAPVRQALQAAVVSTSQLLREAQQLRLAAATEQRTLLLKEEEDGDAKDRNGVGEYNDEDDTALLQDITESDAVDQQQQQHTTTSTVPITAAQDALQRELQTELQQLRDRLRYCIDAPSETWLRPSVIVGVQQQRDDESAPALPEAITQMIMLQLDLDQQQQIQQISTLEETVQYAQKIRTQVVTLLELVETQISSMIAQELQRELLELPSSIEAYFAAAAQLPPLWWRGCEAAVADAVQADATDAATMTTATQASAGANTNAAASEIEVSVEAEMESTTTITVTAEPILHNGAVMATSFAPQSSVTTESMFIDAETVTLSPSKRSQQQPQQWQPEFRDVEILMGEMDPDVAVAVPSAASSMFADNDFDGASAGLMAEIITDEDFDLAMGGNAKVAVSVTTDDDNEEEQIEEDNIVVRVALRSLDVTLFVLEKVIAGVPGSIVASQRIAQRVAEVQRDGRGTQGWTPIKYSAEPKGRY